MKKSIIVITLLLLTIVIVFGCNRTNSPSGTASGTKEIEILNVSYDPTRELYKDFNEVFVKHYRAETGERIVINMSHGGSGKQARSVIDGLKADIVTLALAYDIDIIGEQGKLLNTSWQQQFPYNSSPYTSTIVFLVRKGNPKNIKTWDDLIKPGIQVITPNPKTSGGARWNYLAGWGHILNTELGGFQKLNEPAFAAEVAAAQKKAFEYTKKLFQNVPVLDAGARGSTMTFVQREIGDVLLAWENEAILSINEFGTDKFDIVIPPISILAEPPVAIVDAVVDARGTRKIAEAYLKFLYTKEGQELAAKHYYRPRDPEVAQKYAKQFTDLKLFTIDEAFGGWQKAQELHFPDGGVFDQLYQP